MNVDALSDEIDQSLIVTMKEIHHIPFWLKHLSKKYIDAMVDGGYCLNMLMSNVMRTYFDVIMTGTDEHVPHNDVQMLVPSIFVVVVVVVDGVAGGGGVEV